MISAVVPSKFHMLQPMDKSVTHAKPTSTNTDIADIEVQRNWTATILSFWHWFIGTVLELSHQLPLSSHQQPSTFDALTTLWELLCSTSGAGYDAQDHVFHLLFNLVLHCCDTYLQDTFPAVPAPTKHLLHSYWFDRRQLFDDETCTSAVETFTRVFNVSLLTQAIKSHSAPSACCSSPSHPDRYRRSSPPHLQQPARDSSLSTWGKPHLFPSSSEKVGVAVDLRTSIDLYPTDSSVSSSTVPPLPDFPVPVTNDSPVGA